jgi:transposase, IS6 family
MRTGHLRLAPIPWSALAGFCFPSNVIVLAVRWVQRFTPLLAETARPCRHGVGGRWQVDETYVKVAGKWRYVYCAVDQFGQVIDVFVSVQRDASAARRFSQRTIGTTKGMPVEVVTDRAPVYPVVLEELLPAAWPRAGQDANNRVEARSRPTEARLRPMRGLKQDRSARVVITRHDLCRLCDRATTSSRWRSQRGGGWQWR